MKISARNILAGKVDKVYKGAVNAEIDLTLAGGQKIASTITNGSADALELSEGKPAFAIFKASEVMVGTDIHSGKISARNLLDGVVSSLEHGAVQSEVIIELANGVKVVASITKASAAALGLKVGEKATAIVKASNVLVGV